MYREYHWTPDTVSQILAIDVFQHVKLIFEREAYDKCWALRITLAQNITEPDHLEDLFEEASDIGRIGLRRVETLELLRPAERIRAIGTLLIWHKGPWGRTAGKWLRWLKEQGITPDQAAEQSRRWKDSELSHPFWGGPVPEEHKLPGLRRKD